MVKIDASEGSPSQKSPYHSLTIDVRSSEVGPQSRMKISGLLNAFQEAAINHAGLLGATVADLISRNLTWVLSRYHIQVFRYPLWQESVNLMTWPSARQGLFALREFEIRDNKGILLAAATSSWMLLNLGNKRPVPPSENLPDYPEDPRRALSDSFAPLPLIDRVDFEVPFSVRSDDLDWNSHVNHVVYVEWAVEAAPHHLLADFRPTEIEADYRGETFLGDAVLSRVQILSQEDNPGLVHHIIRADGQKELARLRTYWKK